MEAFALLFPAGIGLLFAIVHYTSERVQKLVGSAAAQLRVGIAGITAAYLFLQLYPQTVLATGAAGYDLANAFLFIGGGFVAFTLLRVLVPQRSGQLHPFLFAAIHLTIGMLLMVFFSFNMLQGWLFLGWALLLSAFSPYSLAVNVQGNLRIAYAAATLLGILATAFLPIPIGWLLLLQAVMTGAFTALLLGDLQLQSGRTALLFCIGAAIGSAAILLL